LRKLSFLEWLFSSGEVVEIVLDRNVEPDDAVSVDVGVRCLHRGFSLSPVFYWPKDCWSPNRSLDLNGKPGLPGSDCNVVKS
jgi:hypothetical protein